MKNKDLSKLIKELRDKLDLTQEQFAQKVGVTFSTINNWEKGTRTPHPFLFQRLMEMAEEAGLPVCVRSRTGRKNIENIRRTKRNEK